MPFLAEKHFPIPTKDLLSWYFDEPIFDQDRPLYIDTTDESKFWTANQCRKGIRQLAAGFKTHGLVAGDCVAILSFNDLNYPLLVNGIIGFGGVYTGCNPAYQPYELCHHLKTSGAKMVVAEPALLPNLLIAAEELGFPRERILMFDNHGEEPVAGFDTWTRLFSHGECDWPRFDDLKTQEETTIALLYSSGTTGLPKAVMLSHRNLIAEHLLFCEWPAPTSWERRRLMALPMFHAATAPLAHFSPLRLGDTIFIMRKFELDPYLANIDKYKITEGAFVPPMVHMILNSPLNKKYSLKSIRYANAGAAPLDRESQNRFMELLRPDTPFTQVWGMTETSCTCSMTPYAGGHEYSGSVGKFLPNIDVKLVDDDGRDISADDIRGELCVRGPLVAKGYYRNAEANARDWDEEGFFHTGDIVYRDGKTKLWYIVDRKKELIKVRGNQVSPSELEGVLLTHPDIFDAAVIGVPSPNGNDEVPRAYITVNPNQRHVFNEQMVRKYMAERLARYKNCVGGVVLMDEIPKTASGKKLKRVLQDIARKEMTSGQVQAKL